MILRSYTRLCLLKQADLDPTIMHGPGASNETGWLAQTVGSRRASAVASSTGSLPIIAVYLTTFLISVLTTICRISGWCF